MPSSPRSMAGVPSSQALLGYLITAPPSVYVPAVLGALAVWIQKPKKIKTKKIQGPLRECRSLRSASWLPYYCTPLVCIPAVIELLAVWRNNKPKTLGIWRAPACPAHCYEIALGFHYETRPASLCRVIFIPFPVSHLAIAWGCTPVMALALSCLL